MSDTRFMPKAALRSTGIRNTTTEVPRVITGAASNMSASAGAPTDGQKAVRKARQLPDTVSQGRGGSRAAVPTRAQDARVTMIQSSSRIRSGGVTGVVGAGLASPFNQDQLLLLGFLLDGHKAVCVTNEDAETGRLTQRTLDVVSALLQAAAQPQAAVAAAAPVAAPPGAGVPLGQPFKTATGSTVVLAPAPAPRSPAAQAALQAVADRAAARAAAQQSASQGATGANGDADDDGPEAA